MSKSSWGLCSVLGVALVGGVSSSFAGSSYDGSWSVSVRSHFDSCESPGLYAIRVENGRISYDGGGVSMSGRVDESGYVRVSIRHGDHRPAALAASSTAVALARGAAIAPLSCAAAAGKLSGCRYNQICRIRPAPTRKSTASCILKSRGRSHSLPDVRLAPNGGTKADILGGPGRGQEETHAPQQTTPLFDHLVGASKQCWGTVRPTLLQD
jgi:hypothetical protein